MSTFNLMANPFAVIGVSIRATRAEIDSAIDDALFDDDSSVRQRALDNARQSLFAPQARLQAEIGFLPGSDDETIADVVASLQSGKPTQNVDNLVGIDRANYLAHRCAVKDTTNEARTAKSLIYAYHDVTLDRVIADIKIARKSSGFGNVETEAARLAFDNIRDRHADAALGGLLSEPEGFEAVAGLAGEIAGPSSSRREFLEILIARYEVLIGPEIEREAEKVRHALEKLDGNQEIADLKAFENALQSWDRLAKPLQVADSIRGIDEPHSREVFELIRRHCIDLANNKSQYSLALSISGVGKEVFAELPDAITLIDTDIDQLKDLVKEQRLDLALSPLISLVETAGNDLSKLGKEARRIQTSRQSTGIMMVLDAALSLGDQQIASIAVNLVRNLAIKLANEGNDNVGALAITEILIKRKDFILLDSVSQLEIDKKILERNIKFENMITFFKDKRLSNAKLLATELLSGASKDDAQIISGILDQISEKEKKTRKNFIRLFIVLGVIFIGSLYKIYNKNESTYTTSPQYGEKFSQLDKNSNSRDVETVDNNKDQEIESAPPLDSINTIFDRSQIRYCMMQNIRIEAAKNSAPESTDYQVEQINTLVNDYNSRCSNFRYDERDMTAVKQEIAQSAVRLRSEGEALLNGGHN